MKRFYLLLMMLFMAFGVYELKAMPPEQKVYVPDIVISYDIDLSYGLDAAVLGFSFTDIIGENIRILYGDVAQGLFTGDKQLIMVKQFEGILSVYLIYDDSQKHTNYIDRRMCYNDSKDYLELGYSMQSLYRLYLDDALSSKDYEQLGYSIKY